MALIKGKDLKIITNQEILQEIKRIEILERILMMFHQEDHMLTKNVKQDREIPIKMKESILRLQEVEEKCPINRKKKQIL